MTKNSIVKCEKGLTLIEVLASLVILGIVFIGFMNIFPQMTVFNKKTETKLDTMNLARQEIVIIKSLGLELPFSSDQVTSLGVPEVILNSSDTFEIKYDKAGYEYHVAFSKNPDLGIEENTNNIALHKVHLQMFVDNNQLSSETYGYLEIVGKEEVGGS